MWRSAGSTALFKATGENLLSIAEILLENGADPSLATNDGFTPLMLGAYRGLIPVVQVLISHGADVNKDLQTKDNKEFVYEPSPGFVPGVNAIKPEAFIQPGSTPLYLATLKNHLDMVKLLVKHGAHVKHPHMLGSSPLHVPK